MFETYRKAPATKPSWSHTFGGYVGDFYDLMELVASRLPPVPGTLGAATSTARGKAIQRALDDVLRIGREAPKTELNIAAPLTIQRGLRGGQNRRRRRA